MEGFVKWKGLKLQGSLWVWCHHPALYPLVRHSPILYCLRRIILDYLAYTSILVVSSLHSETPSSNKFCDIANCQLSQEVI